MSGPSVLLVDDDRQVHVGLTATFRTLDFELTCVGGAEEAKKHLSQNPPEAMICDVMMPGVSGITLLHYVRETHPMIPVVMLTGQANQDRLLQAFRLGAVDFLFKPVTKAALEHTLGRAMEERDRRRGTQQLHAELERFSIMIGEDGIAAAVAHEWQTAACQALARALASKVDG